MTTTELRAHAFLCHNEQSFIAIKQALHRVGESVFDVYRGAFMEGRSFAYLRYSGSHWSGYGGTVLIDEDKVIDASEVLYE